jgi:hypothetical protein
MSAKTRPCEICKKLIEPERVEGIPETRLCLEHANMIKPFGGEFFTTYRRDNLGKVGSLKQITGGVSTRMVRNTAALNKLRRAYDEAARSKA